MMVRVILFVAVGYVMGIRGETVLTKDFAESLIDIAYKKYDAFVGVGPDPGQSGKLLQCDREADGFVCKVNSDYVLPMSLVTDVIAYFRTVANERLPGSRVITATDDKLHLFVRRFTSLNFNVYFPLKKSNSFVNILEMLASLV